jgi:hypothetical protein
LVYAVYTWITLPDWLIIWMPQEADELVSAHHPLLKMYESQHITVDKPPHPSWPGLARLTKEDTFSHQEF